MTDLDPSFAEEVPLLDLLVVMLSLNQELGLTTRYHDEITLNVRRFIKVYLNVHYR